MSFLPNLITATGGTTARSIRSVFADWNNVKSFGAVGTGSPTVDLTALTATTSPVYLPNGTFYTGTNIYSLAGNKRYYSSGGSGVIQTSEAGSPTKQAPSLAIITAQPAQSGSGAFNKYFGGDFTNSHMPWQTYISGSAPLGTPSSGFSMPSGLSGIEGYLGIAANAGYNNGGTAGNGRTGVVMSRMILQHGGNGDAGVYYGSVTVSGTNPAATYFTGSPAGGMLGGQVVAGADKVYLQGLGDLNFVDGGFTDVTALPVIINMSRTTAPSGTWNTPWTGVEIQATGSVAIDSFFAGHGPSRMGFDLTNSTLQDYTATPTYAAMALKRNMRFYMNASNAGSFSDTTVFNTEWYEFDATLGHSFVIGSASVLNANANRVFIANSGTPPAANPTGGGYLYVDAGALKYRGSAGTVTTIAAA